MGGGEEQLGANRQWRLLVHSEVKGDVSAVTLLDILELKTMLPMYEISEPLL